MAATAYLLYKVVQPGETLVEGISAMVYVGDDGDSEEATMAAACDLLRSKGYMVPNNSYFELRETMTEFSTEGDHVIFAPGGPEIYID